jgi:hypothetical protein
MINIYVTVGSVMWARSKQVHLAACPHVGDDIDVDGITVHCQIVCIGKQQVYVRDPKGCLSQESADELTKAGWK